MINKEGFKDFLISCLIWFYFFFSSKDRVFLKVAKHFKLTFSLHSRVIEQ